MKNDDLIIREMELSDLTQELYDALPSNTKSVDFELMKSHLEKRLNNGIITLAAYVDDKFAGTASLIVDHKLDGRILGFYEDFYVLKEYRGHGIGARIAIYITLTAWDLGCTQILGMANKSSKAGKIHMVHGGKIADGFCVYKDNPKDGLTRDNWVKQGMPPFSDPSTFL